MKSRSLRVVPDCPQPETPVKPVVYGQAPWSRLPHNPTADEITIRVRAQSILSKGGKRAELPDIETARRVIAAHQSMPASAPSAAPSSRGVREAGSHQGEVQ